MAHKPLSRRTFLRGAGVTIALPFLEAMLPIHASAAVGGAPQRFVAMLFPNGAIISPPDNNWDCTGSGANYNLSSALQPLAPYKSYVSPILNLTNNGYKIAYGLKGGESHAYAAFSFLTGQNIDWGERLRGPKLMMPGASVDQMIAAKTPNAVKSIVMGLEAVTAVDAAFGQVVSEMSYKSQTEMLDRADSSKKVFDILFGGGGGTLPNLPPPSTSLALRRKSIIDLVKGDLDSLLKGLGSRDKIKMDEFITSVGAVERKIASDISSTTPPPPTGGSCTPANAGTYTSDNDPLVGNLGVRCKNMLDMMVIAFQCDITRVSSFMLGNENTYVPLRSLDASLPDANHHGVSHYHGDSSGGVRNMFHQVNLWQAKQLAYLLGKLQTTTDAYGPLIENTLVLFGSGMADGEHFTYTFDGVRCDNWNKIPMLLAGRGGGHRSGILYNAGHGDNANLLAAIAQAYGAGSKVGASTGVMPGLF